MNRSNIRRSKSVTRIESQDDIGFLTGRRSQQEEDKQIKTPAPRKQGGHDERRMVTKSDQGSQRP